MTDCEDNHNNYLYTYCPECGIKLDKDKNLLEYINKYVSCSPFTYIKYLDIHIKNMFNKDLYLVIINNKYKYVYIEYFVELYNISKEDLIKMHDGGDIHDFGKLNDNHEVHNFTFPEKIFKKLLFKIKYPELSKIEHELYSSIENIIIALNNNNVKINESVISDMIKRYNK